MKRLLAFFLVLPGLALASAGGIKLDTAPVDLNNLPSLQRGAQVFVNYCLNCHSASYMRYNRLSDLGLTEQQIKDNLMFAADKVGETMNVAMRMSDAKVWFGAPPPDLTVIARSRGPDWLYTYLRTFYRDADRVTGWNNLAFPSVGMPHALYELQGVRPLVIEEVAELKDDGGKSTGAFSKRITTYDSSGVRSDKLEKLAGSNHHASTSFAWGEPANAKVTPAQYDQLVGDLVNYLVYMGEPAANKRLQVGIYVMLFLIVLIVVTRLLKQAYWKDLH
jgi:ubiquinol-cytochrome c reductase cytochrome c1 subunit